VAHLKFDFPNPVDEISARLVAAGVVIQAGVLLGTRQWWLLAPLTYGFVARVASGPRYSPLGLLVTRVVRPRLAFEARLVPGPPKRFAQGLGVAFSLSAVLFVLLGLPGAAMVALAMLLAAASLEAFAGICLGCKVFALLMKAGVVPESVCIECADISDRLAA
jgi:hypothetical protein